MTDSQKLHTAARRYCIERYQYRRESDKKIVCSQLFFQFQAITLEVERFDFDALPDVEELRDLLKLAGQIAESGFTWPDAKERQQWQQAIREIRQQFAHFIQNFDCDVAVEPLPYRRVLFGRELESVAKILRESWGATKIYYFPLQDATSAYAPTLFAYNDVDFEEAIPEEKLAEILHKRGINRVYEIRERGDENYLQDVELMNPSYTGAEVFISSENWDWLFYASHEASVTTGGWLTKAIQDEWPDWEKAKYDPIWWQK